MKIVTSMQMQQMEKNAIASGESELRYMENAGSGIARAIEEFLVTPDGSGEIYLLVGKGNNGGDALAVGEILAKKGYSVTAFCLYHASEHSSLSKKMAKRFEKAGGKTSLIFHAPEFKKGVIIDGLLGTGFEGKVEGLCAEVIEAANGSRLPIFAIDIPSGLSGNTGAVEGVAIMATETLFLGYPKLGFFLKNGWDHVGQLTPVDFGLPERFSEDILPEALLASEERAMALLPPIVRSRHKYQTGYVLAVAGGASMPGAALLSCLAALRAGAGIVRLFHPAEATAALAFAPFELIRESWDLKDPSRLFEEASRAKAFLIGPGMGRGPRVFQALETLLPKISIPTVIDADGLFVLSKKSAITLPEKTILTPHRMEMERLLGESLTTDRCKKYASRRNVTIVLKGAPTIIFFPHATPLIVPQGDPGMATAGTGDVLTGVLAALLAQGLSPPDAAVLGAVMHGIAGEEAADRFTSYGMIASDLIEYLPDAIGHLQQRSVT